MLLPLCCSQLVLLSAGYVRDYRYAGRTFIQTLKAYWLDPAATAVAVLVVMLWHAYQGY